MYECLVERELAYSTPPASERRRFVFRLFIPFEFQEGMVDFAFSKGAAGRTYEIDGLPHKYSFTCIGADRLQALQLAADVDGHLRMFRDKYEFFFTDGEPYFED